MNDNFNNEDKKKNPSLLLLILLTTFAVLSALGLSFSAVTLLESNETINTIISIIKGDDDKESYIITYMENSENQKNGVNLTNQFPISDTEGKLLQGSNYVFNFSLLIGKNTKDYYYEITAVPNLDNTLNSKYVKLYLQKNNQDIPFSYNNLNKVKVYSEYLNSKYSEAVGQVIYSDKITSEDIGRGRIDFVMRMWISEDAPYTDDLFNKKFGIKINTYVATK